MLRAVTAELGTSAYRRRLLGYAANGAPDRRPRQPVSGGCFQTPARESNPSRRSPVIPFTNDVSGLRDYRLSLHAPERATWRPWWLLLAFALGLLFGLGAIR
jgi:hypothetical protein